jgi:hypothetical protein
MVNLCVIAMSALAVAGCGSSGNSSGTTSTSPGAASSSTTFTVNKAPLCQARNQLKASVSALRSAITSLNASNIKSAFDAVQTDFSNLKAVAGDTYKPQVDSLQSALQELQAAVGQLGNGNVVQNMTAVTTAANAVRTSTDNLVNTLRASCGT